MRDPQCYIQKLFVDLVEGPRSKVIPSVGRLFSTSAQSPHIFTASKASESEMMSACSSSVVRAKRSRASTSTTGKDGSERSRVIVAQAIGLLCTASTLAATGRRRPLRPMSTLSRLPGVKRTFFFHIYLVSYILSDIPADSLPLSFVFSFFFFPSLPQNAKARLDGAGPSADLSIQAGGGSGVGRLQAKAPGKEGGLGATAAGPAGRPLVPTTGDIDEDLYNAAMADDISTVDRLIKAGGDPLATFGDFDLTSFHVCMSAAVAARLTKGCLDAPESICPVWRDSRGNTPVHTCARSNRQDAALGLIECGFDLQLKNDAGRTPAQVARSFHFYNTARILDRLRTARAGVELIDLEDSMQLYMKIYAFREPVMRFILIFQIKN